jgi:heat shock protein HslJ
MKNFIFIILIISNSIIYGQTKPQGSYKLISIRDLISNHADTASQQISGGGITFKSDTTLTGAMSRNSFSGSYHVNENNIKIITFGYTKMCCDNELSKQFYNELEKVENFLISADTLILTRPNKTLYLIKIH